MTPTQTRPHAETASTPRASKSSRAAALVAWLFVVFPAVLFYWILARTALNMPLIDDYDAILGFLNQMVGLHSFSARAYYFLTAQHNEYKLFFGHAVVWAQYCLQGRVNFFTLFLVGNSFVLLLAILLFKMLLPEYPEFSRRVAFFIPVSWLVFQLQYWETLNWAMASLQNVSVIVFALASIYFLVPARRGSFPWAIVCLVLAIAASGNGFLVVPVGVLALAVGRHWRQLLAWVAVALGCVAVYAYHYNVMSSQSPRHGSVFAALTRVRPDFAIAFIGNAASVGKSPLACILLGSILCLFFALLAWRGYPRRNPRVCCCILFLLLTAVGVAGLRSDFGMEQSFAIRYTIYGALFLIFAWIALVEEFLQHRKGPLLNNGAFLGAVFVTMLFALFTDEVGYLTLLKRNEILINGMRAYEQSAPGSPGAGPALQLKGEPAAYTAFRPRARTILTRSIELGIYRPPQY
jgi:hypothetical protein